MARICSIHQPSYWPYLGLFDKVARSDVFVFLDDVQYVKNDFKNRNRIFINSAASADPCRVGWLTLPVRHVAMTQTIEQSDVIDGPRVMRKHWSTVHQAYATATGFPGLKDRLLALFHREMSDPLALAEINIAVIEFGLNLLNIDAQVAGRSSDIQGKSNDPTQRLIDICKHVGADTYLAGAGGHDYMSVEEFQRHGIRLLWQEWKPAPYPQQHSPSEFVPYLSCLDFFLNLGADSAKVFRASQTTHVIAH